MTLPELIAALERAEGPSRSPNSDDAPPLVVLEALAWCFASWQPEVRVVGNVRAGDALRAIREAHAALKARA